MFTTARRRQIAAVIQSDVHPCDAGEIQRRVPGITRDIYRHCFTEGTDLSNTYTGVCIGNKYILHGDILYEIAFYHFRLHTYYMTLKKKKTKEFSNITIYFAKVLHKILSFTEKENYSYFEA